MSLFFCQSAKYVAPSQFFGRGKCKISRQIFGQKPPSNDLRKPHRIALVLAKHLNRRRCCSALAASRRRRMPCKTFRQPRVNSPCGSGSGQGIDDPCCQGGVRYFIAASGQRLWSCGCNGTPELKTLVGPDSISSAN